MNSKLVTKMLASTPEYIKVFNELYSDLVMRVHQILTDKGISQNELAKKLDKSPSEVSKWLNGGHNMTLMSIAKLQAELGEQLLNVPEKKQYTDALNARTTVFTVIKNDHKRLKSEYFEPVLEMNKEILLTHAG